MKRKYYMRGLGFGILITAAICAVALPKEKEPMTDEEVIARATELGYVKEEGGVTADDIDKIKEKASGTPEASQNPEATDVPEESGEPEGTPGPTQSPVPTPEAPDPPEEPDKPDVPATPTPKPTATVVPTKAPTDAPKPTATIAPTETPTATATPAVGQETGKTSYTITVQRGATARKVAEQLAVAGAIDDANAFVKYLQTNKLTDYINIGTFTIPQGASHGEIAKILTGK